MLTLHRAPPSIRLLIAVALVGAVYAFALQDRLHDFPRAFSGFGFHPEAVLAASGSTRLHVGAGALAVLLGLLQLALPKGTPRHRALGYLWVVTMAALCLSALFMKERFGLLQMLAVVVVGLMARAIFLVRRKDIAGHAHLMRVLVLGATVGVGLFTALPGRVTWSLFFTG
jgi:uncharacterized membrane protein